MIRVLLVDDHAILREGLRALLRYYEDVSVVGEAQDGLEALRTLEWQEVDIVLMDIAMPVLNGIEATRRVREQFKQVRVLVLTQYDDYQYVAPILEAGASGYVLKRALGKDLILALRTVAGGGVFLHPEIAASLSPGTYIPRSSRKSLTPLTDREIEVLKYIADGLTGPEIATILNLSIKTVDWHRTNLMSKLGVHNVAHLVRYAFQQGLVIPDPGPLSPHLEDFED